MSGWSGLESYFLSLLEAITRSQSLTLCFFRNFFVKYFKYLHQQRSIAMLSSTRQAGRHQHTALLLHLTVHQEVHQNIHGYGHSIYLFDM